MFKSRKSKLKKFIPIGEKPCLALWVPCCWENKDPFPEEAKEFFEATSVVEHWKWVNGSTHALRYQLKSGPTISVSVQKWVVWNPNAKEFYEYSDSDFKAKFKAA